ncbi:hypothetical protein EMIT0P253_170052 [Pseudomonas sp. IT-P253]
MWPSAAPCIYLTSTRADVSRYGLRFVCFWPFSAGRHYGVCWSGRMQFDWSVTMQMVKSMQLRRLTLKTDERPPAYGKPPGSKVFQRYRLAQESPPKYC